MEIDIDGVTIPIDDRFIAALREQIGDRQLKRAYLTVEGKYSEQQLLATAFIDGCWEGLKHQQAGNGDIKAAKSKSVSRIEGAYKS